MKRVLIPVLTLAITLIVCIILQSCGAVRVDKLTQPMTLTEAQQAIKINSWLLGFTMLTGVCFAWYISVKIKDVDRRIEKLINGG